MNFRIRKKVFYISTSVLLAVGLFIILLFVFSLLAHEVVLENEDWFDSYVFDFFKLHSSPKLISFFKFVTFFGSTAFFLPAYILLVLILLLKRRRTDALNIALLSISSTLLMFGLKRLFARKRPELPLFRELSNYSFPSGHALSSFVFSCVLIWLIWKSNLDQIWKMAISICLICFSLCVAISRIALRYHYASDVLAGLCLGFGWVLLFFLLRRWMDLRKRANAH